MTRRWSRACSKSFHLCPQAQQMARGSTHTAARAPVSARLGKGCNKEPGHCSLAPRVAAVKGSICRVAKAAPGRQQPVRSVFRALRLAAIAFAKQGTRCGSFEQALSHACLLQGVPACMLFLACRNWPGRVACIAAGSDRGGPFSDACNVQIAHAPPASQHVRLRLFFTASAAFAAPHAWPRLA